MEEQAKKHIMIIDDSMDDRAIAKKILETNNFKVTESASWFEALEFLGKENFDLILLDLSMPDIDGFDLLEIIRKNKSKKELPIVAYSSYDRSKIKDNSQINGFIEKYCAPEEFIKSINKILGL